MKIHCIKNKYKDNYVAFCLECNSNCDIEYEDYFEKHPMIWCWTCESKFVIDYQLNKFHDFLDFH